ncbi:MAG TPA: DNA ligase [Gammaproteobacteria bacterium]|jgi:DNA ligase-1|nr:DNA ligase [Gammaproteobacteria bacterium]
MASKSVFYVLVLLLLFLSFVVAKERHPPPVLLANVYDNDIDVSQYWISEKYDGVRAYWDGNQFISRQGNIYHAPPWFIAKFPKIPLDGELWMGRGQFQQLVSAVRKDQPVDEEWRKVSYQVFELPGGKGSFTERLAILKTLLKSYTSDNLKLVPQYRLPNNEALQQQLDKMVAGGAEGLMLHRADALYTSGRSDDLLKLKPYFDAEARVIKHLPGKGKYTGMLGALLVESDTGLQFRLGTGFSDIERQNPPPLDAIVTYRYFGRTNSGKPRFASFLRIRRN